MILAISGCVASASEGSPTTEPADTSMTEKVDPPTTTSPAIVTTTTEFVALGTLPDRTSDPTRSSASSTTTTTLTRSIREGYVPNVYEYDTVEEAENAVRQAGLTVVVRQLVLPPQERENTGLFGYVDPPVGQQLSAGSEVVLGVYVDPATNWALDGDKPDGTWTVFDESDGLSSPCVSAVAVDPDGAVWAGCSKGVNVFRDGQWEVVRDDLDVIDLVSSPSGFIFVSVYDGTVKMYSVGEWRDSYRGGKDLAVARDGTVWVAGGYVYRFTAEGHSRAEGVEGHFFALSPEGLLYVSGPETPTYAYDGEWTVASEQPNQANVWPGSPTLDGLEFYAMVAADDGTIWAASRWYGVFRHDGTGWAQYTVEDGLPSNRVTSIAIAPDGTVWIGTADAGVASFKPST